MTYEIAKQNVIGISQALEQARRELFIAERRLDGCIIRVTNLERELDAAIETAKKASASDGPMAAIGLEVSSTFDLNVPVKGKAVRSANDRRWRGGAGDSSEASAARFLRLRGQR